MKNFFYILLVLIVPTTIKAQFTTVTNTAGTVLYGSTNVTVVGAGTASSYALWCGTGPYWIGAGTGGTPTPGSYTFTFSPSVNSARIYFTAADPGESISISINGVHYSLTAANLVPWPSTCGTPSMVLSGDSLISTGSNSSAILNITYCPINSMTVETDGLMNGTVFTYMFSDSGSCFSATSNSPVCFGDTLHLHAIGGDTVVPYTWHGPGGYTATGRNPNITPATFADSGWYFVVQTVSGVNDTAWTHVVMTNCMIATSNSAICWGDTLRLHVVGGNSLFTYNWYNSAGLLATGTNPVLPNANFSDSGMIFVVQTIAGSNDTAWTHVVIKPKPLVTATSNSPLCSSTGDTLLLYSGVFVPGETFSWTGPNLFSSTLENPTIAAFIAMLDTGTYTVIANLNGCKDTATTHVVTSTPPLAPVISGITDYCLAAVPTPFTLTGVLGGATILWYTTATGGTGSSTPPIISTSAVGCTTYWATQSAPCESPRASITVCIHPNPATPTLTANPVCADSTLKLFSTDATMGITLLWSGPSGFSSTIQNPIIVNAQTGNSGTYTLAVTDTVYHCVSSATISAFVNPTPSLPLLQADSPCNGGILNLTASGSGTGSVYAWSGPASYTITNSNPSINPAILGTNDGVYTVVANIGNCPSLPDSIRVVIHPNPVAPKVSDTAYCQKEFAVALVASGDSGSVLKWFTTSIGGAGTTVRPIPQTTIVGTTTWYVDQTSIYGCISPRTPHTATILYLPQPAITLSNSFACQDSTLVLSYSGVSMTEPGYLWTLPWYLHGSSLVGGALTDSSITVRFDSTFNNVVYLHAADYNGRCSHDTSIIVRIVPRPKTNLFIYPHLCVGDTVSVALTMRDTSAYSFNWDFDNATIITANSNSGGPYGVRWNDYGTKLVTVVPETIEGCRGKKMFDTVNVRNIPNTGFHIEGRTREDTVLCMEDSVKFVADMGDSTNYAYEWAPAHFFHQNNKGTIWGRIETSSDVTLKITDVFGCTGEGTQHFEPETCCNIYFPTAFSPNGDGRNDKFRPVAAGFHRFHVFRIQNRWGQTVYETTNSDGEWDGTFGGLPQDIGVYFYYLKVDCGDKTIEKRGDVTLVR